MKVSITKESRKWMTVEELPYAKQIVTDCRMDEMSAVDYAQFAADAIMWSRYRDDSVKRIIEASAEVCRDNAIALDRFGADFGRLGVWIDFIAETYDGFLKVGCLLSDIWDLSGDDETKRTLASHAYIRYYTEQK